MSRFSHPVALEMRFDTNPKANLETVELHPENCIDMGMKDDKMPGWMESTLAFHGWKHFASTPTSGHTSLCAKFMYHAKGTDEDSILICRQEISFTPASIREAYALPTVETCSYSQLIQRQGDTTFEKEVSDALSLPVGCTT